MQRSRITESGEMAGLTPGVVVPLFTPLTPTGEVDPSATTRLIEHVLQAAVQGIFILGSSGEGHSLSLTEQYRFASLVPRVVNDRVPLYLGLLQPGTQGCVDFALQCPSLSAYRAIVTGVPYCRFLSCIDEVKTHFQYIHDSVGLPVIVYHLPHPASEILTPQIATEVAALDGVIGWKDSSGKSDCIEALLESGIQSTGFRIYEGGPERSALSLRMGCDGLIPGPGNYIPHLFCKLYQAIQHDDHNLAENLQHEIDQFRQFARQPNPFVTSGFHFSTFKAGLDVMGIGGGTPALPYQRLPEEYHDNLRPYFEAAGVGCSSRNNGETTE